MIEVNKNELSDDANSALLQGLEIVKSPTPLEIRDNQGNAGIASIQPTNPDFVYSYSIQEDTRTGDTFLQFEGVTQLQTSTAGSSGAIGTISVSGKNVTCDGTASSQNNFQYQVSSVYDTPICLEVLIQPLSNRANEYNVTSKVLYELDDEILINILRGTRYIPFE